MTSYTTSDESILNTLHTMHHNFWFQPLKCDVFGFFLPYMQFSEKKLLKKGF